MRGTDSIPAMHNNGQSVVIRHKEFLGEVRSSTAFSVQYSFPLNPGIIETFPWLAGIANRFQEYRIKGMVFHYVPSSGSAIASTNNALGTVMMQTSYRANDEKPLTKLEVLNEYWSCESVPSEPFCHPIECDPKENPFNIHYVRSTSPPAADSILLYDLGQTHLCVSGQQVNDVILGDLWVTYEIELKKPIVTSNVTNLYQAGYAHFNNATAATLLDGPDTNIGEIQPNYSGKTIQFPPRLTGVYLITVTVRASTGAFTAFDFTGTSTLTNASFVPFPGSGSVYYRTVLAGTSPTLGAGLYQVIVNITDPNKTATLVLPPTATFTASGFVSTDVMIAPFAVAI
jgi:hypothetical protein